MNDDDKLLKTMGMLTVNLIKALGAEVSFPNDPDHYVVKIVPGVPHPPAPPRVPGFEIQLRYKK